VPRLALYASFRSQIGAEPLGSTYTLRSQYEDAMSLHDVVRGVERTNHGRGRWCFGTINSAKGRLHAHYPFPMCTPFAFHPNQSYTIDAIYDEPRRIIALWVDGQRKAVESRWLQVEDGLLR
jgi:hypothetical protein